nr:hypothetical protein [uncultured Carboxylicivirga sp.]
MSQFDKTTFITFKQGDTESIKSALTQYQDYLNADKAFTKEFMGMFNIEFKIETSSGIRRLQTSDTQNTLLLKQALSMGPESCYTTELITDNDEIYISEPIFFAIALEHPALKDDIASTAQAMVTAMRRYNDTDSVWIDDMRIFGIEALYLLACTYPEYTYLLGQFFIPYWDLEHAVGYESYLFSLVKQHGWTRDLIKAFIWCDNGYFRYCMYGEGDRYLANTDENLPLGDYFKQNPTEYEWFQQAVIDRFEQAPMLLYSAEDDATEKEPVVELYTTFFHMSSDYFGDNESDQFLHDEFITDTIENEAYDLQEKVAASVSGSLVAYSKRNQEERDEADSDDEYIYKGDGIRDLKEFIVALPNGAIIWKYIETGDDAQALEQITQTELVPIANKHARNFYKKLTYSTSPLNYQADINNHLTNILSDVMYDLLDNDDEDYDATNLGNGLISRISVRPQDGSSSANQTEQNIQQFLRILDVLFRLLDVEKLDSELEEILTDEQDRILTTEAFYQRYSKSKQAPKKKKLSLNSSTFGSARNEIDYDVRLYIDKVIRQNDREAFDCSNWGQPKLGTITMAAYLTYTDRTMMMFDESTQKLLEYIGEGPWQDVYHQICQHLNTDEISEADQALLKEYLTLVNGKPEASEAQVLAILNKHLHREEIYRGDLTFNKFNAQQPSYSLFFFDDGFQHVLLCCYWMRHLNPPIVFMASRLFNLFLKLAPQKVLKQIAKFYSDDYSAIQFDDVNREENFYKELERAKVPKEQLYAFQMVNAQNLHSIANPCNVDEYMIWLNLYDDIDDEDGGMFSAARRNKALALEQGMHSISERDRLKYYIDLATLNERFPFDQPKEFERCLLHFIQLNTRNEDDADATTLTSQVLTYINGDVSYDQIKEAFEKNIHQDLDAELNHISTYSLGQFFWQLPKDQQKRLAILLLNHSYRGYSVLTEDLFYAHLRQLVTDEEMSMEEYLGLSAELHSEESDEYMEDAYDQLYNWLEELQDDIRQDYFISFLLHSKSDNLKEYLIDRVRDNNIKAFIKNSTPSNRIELLQLLKEEPDAQDLIIPFVNDSSRKVKAVAKSFLK